MNGTQVWSCDRTSRHPFCARKSASSVSFRSGHSIKNCTDCNWFCTLLQMMDGRFYPIVISRLHQCEHVSMWAALVSSSLRSIFFPFTRRRFRYFVLSALNFGEFKCFHDSIYRNRRELFLFILNVNEHDFESPWLWEQLYFDPVAFDD